MGKTPGKWIKTLLLGKKSPKSNLVVSAKDDFSNLSLDPPVASSRPVDTASTALNVVTPSNGDDLESRNDLERLKLEQAAIKVQAVFRARQARRSFRTLKGIIRLQAVIRGHLVRRQAVATYSCIWGIVKFQALVRGNKARSSDNGIQCQKPHMETADSEALQLSTYSWMNHPTKFVIVDKLLASSPTVLPIKIQYGLEEPNSAKVWLERWTQLQVWSPRSRAARILVPKSKTKKRNYQAVVESEKARPKRGAKKQSGPTSGNGSNRSTTESEKPKRSVRKASPISKDPLRTESDKAKHNTRKSRSASKEGSPLEVKDEKPSVRRSSLSNKSVKVSRKSAEKKKDTVDSVQIEPEVKVSDILEGGHSVESAEKEKDIADSVQIEPEVKVSDVLEGEGHAVESAKKEKETADSVQLEPEVKVSDVLEGGHAVESAVKDKETVDSVQIVPEVKVSDIIEGGDAVESAEKEKETVDSVQIVPEVKVSDIIEGGDAVESAEKEKETADSVQLEPEVKASDVLEGGHAVESAEKEKETAETVHVEPEVKVSEILEGGGHAVESAEKEKDTRDVVSKELDVEEKENSPEKDELRTAETRDKGEDLKCSDVKVSSENVASDNSKPSERRVSLHANIDNQDDGLTHSGRKIPSYMAPTASAKARVKGEGSPRFAQEKNGTLRRHSLPSPANGKLSTTTTMSPRAHRILLASSKGSMNGDKSVSSSKNTSDKSNRTEWKR